MAIAYDNVSTLAESSATASWTHTPTGTPKGVIVCITASGAPATSGVTYDGVAMTNIDSAESTGEAGSVSVWFLGTNVPSGAKTVQVTRSASSLYIAAAFTVTATYDTVVENSTSGYIASTNNTGSSITITNGTQVFMAGALYSGENALTSITSGTDIGGGTPGGVHSNDFGTDTGIINRRTNIYTGTGSGYTGFDWTQSADDMAWAIIAVKEGPAPKTADAGDVTVTPTTEASGFPERITDSGDVTITPTATGTPAGTSKPDTAGQVTVTPTTSAVGNATKFSVAGSVPVAPVTTGTPARTVVVVAGPVTVTPSSTGTPNAVQTATFELWENGSFVASLGTQNIQPTGTLLEFDITPYITSLADQTGANVELRITSGSDMYVNAAEWQAFVEKQGQNYTAPAGLVSVTPITVASGQVTRITVAGDVTVTPTTTAIPSGTAKPTVAGAVTVTPSTSADGYSVHLSAAGLVTVTPVTVGTPAPAFDEAWGIVTVSPITTASGTASKSVTAGSVDLTPTTSTFGTKTALSIAGLVTVTPTTSAASDAARETSAGAVTVTPTTSAISGAVDKPVTAGLVTVSPVTVATPAPASDEAWGVVTVTPVTTATPGATSKPDTADLVTVSPSTSASANVTKSVTADTSVTPVTTAALSVVDKPVAAGAVTVTPVTTAVSGTGATEVSAGLVTVTPATTATSDLNRVVVASDTSMSSTTTADATVTRFGSASLSAETVLQIEMVYQPYFVNEDHAAGMGTTASVDIPLDVQTGDIGLIILSRNGQSAYLTQPAGFTLLATQEISTTHQSSLWWKLLDASEAGDTVSASWATTNEWAMGIVVYSSTSGMDGWDVLLDDTPGTDVSWPFQQAIDPGTTAVLLAGTRRSTTGGSYTHTWDGD